VAADDDDLFMEIHLSPLPFWQRVKNAARYILGQRSLYGDFEEICLSTTDALILGDALVNWSSDGKLIFDNNDVY
jgi:hypothetical protein